MERHAVDPGARHVLRRVMTVLDPATSAIEIIIGVVVILGITSSGRMGFGPPPGSPLGTVQLGALTAVAWALIDAALVLLASLIMKARRRQAEERVRAASDAAGRRRAIADVYDETLAGSLPEPELDRVYARLAAHAATARTRVAPDADDGYAMAATVLCVLFAMLPPLVPFLLPLPELLALAVSNAVAVLTLFVVGFLWAKYTTFGRWLAGTSIAAIGLAMVALTVLLGVN